MNAGNERTDEHTDRSMLHPHYGWHEADTGFSWRKLRLFYADERRRPSFIRLMFAPVALLYGSLGFFTGLRGIGTYVVVVLSTLVTYWCLRPFLANVIRFWQTTQIHNSPPGVQANGNTKNTRALRDPPTRIVDGHLVVSTPILAVDRSDSPQRIYTKQQSPYHYRWLGSYYQVGETGTEVIVNHPGPLLRAAQIEGIPIEHLLATHELHELAHWALEDDNAAVENDHAPAWNRRLSAEVGYVSDDDSALWDPQSYREIHDGGGAAP